MINLIPLILTCASGVHIETMYPLIKTESGFNPYAIAIVRDKPLARQPQTKEEAEIIIDELEARKVNFSVGLGQINKVNFNRFNVTGKDLLDPCTNLQVSEKILTECYERSPNTQIGQALSCYYAGNFKYGFIKEGKTAYVERIVGNYLPGTKITALAIPSIENEINHIKKEVVSRNAKRQSAIKTVSFPNSKQKLVKNLSSKKPASRNIFSMELKK